jgi:2-keto-3-deoxy-L-fuconate dehydrogenase
VYGASKTAVIGIIKLNTIDHVKGGIRCNAIFQRIVNTPSLHKRLRSIGEHDQSVVEFAGCQPMSRLAEAGEIATLAPFFANDTSGFTH